MKDYTIVFKGTGVQGVSYPNQTVTAASYTVQDGFIDFFNDTEEGSIASFAAGEILSVVRAA